MIKTHFWLYSFTLSGLILSAKNSLAQTYQPSDRSPVADSTLGTQVSSGDGKNFDIKGGFNRGQTLFHSFQDFSVPTGGAANFANPAGMRDMISRVTGGSFSDINGRINSNGANFFLINPNGIVFGPNAQLNVGRAFMASTANGINLVDAGGRAITFGTNPNGDAPLLTINPNVFFNVSRLNMGGGNGAISNFGTLQTPNNSQYIGLIGGNVILDGSQGGGKIIAPGGRVDIGGLSGAGSVSVDNNGLVFSSGGVGRSNVLLTNNAGILARATGNLDTVNTFFNNATAPGSSINISANNLDVLNSGAKLADQDAAIDAGLDINLQVPTKTTGNINIDATGKVNLNNADIKNTLGTGSEGSIGDIKIQAGTLDIKNHSTIATTTRGKGNAGNIDINTTGDINISGNDSGATDATIISNFSFINSNTYGQGDTGKITINTQGKLSLINLGGISSAVGDTGVGNGQGIFITARELNLANRSSIRSNTEQSAQGIAKGNAGDINIKTTGDINIAGYNSSATNPATANSYVYNDTNGYGDAGKITIATQGKLSLANQGSITSDVQDTAVGNGKGISITARELELKDDSYISTNTFQTAQINGKGNAGNIDITTTGDIKIAGGNLPSLFNSNSKQIAYISSDTSGYGDTGKVNINTQGKLSVVDRAGIFSQVLQKAVGNSNGINITARELELANNGLISTNTFDNSKGNGGDIKIQTSGDIKISGYNSSIDRPISDISDRSQITSLVSGQGDAGKITIDTQGKLSVVNQGDIGNFIYTTGIGNSKGINITARELELANNSLITSATSQSERVNGKGNAGDIDIKTTGDIKISEAQISNGVGQGGIGKGGNIEINTRNLSAANGGGLTASTSGQGDAGSIKITATDNISFDGFSDTSRGGAFSAVNPEAAGKGGNVEINTRNLTLTNTAAVSASTTGKGDAGNVKITATDNISFDGSKNGLNSGAFSSVFMEGAGKGGNVEINARNLSVTNGGRISVSSTIGQGDAGNILLNANTIALNKGDILSRSPSSNGGNINLTTKNYLLLRNGSFIVTDSDSTDKNGNGGNITINSPAIVATPGNNDITANAYQGNGGRVNITSQGLFGIQYRATGSPLTNDITASSTFGQSGNVNVNTPGTDPGKDSTVLPTVPTDASNQIAQTCNASRENKFIIAGRGGMPPNADEPLTSDVVWQDPRATKTQPAANSTTNNPPKYPPPAVGLVLDGKGKAFLVAAATPGQPTKTNATCPQAKEQFRLRADRETEEFRIRD